MEVLALSLLAVVIYFLFLGVKFTSFKSKLMNEFGRRGVRFDEADTIFAEASEDISKLHHAGMPIEQIVDRYMPNETHKGETQHEQSGLTLTNDDHELSRVRGRKENSEDIGHEDDKSSTIIKIVSRLLHAQQSLFLSASGEFPNEALDAWSLGYVAGVTDAVLQENGYEADAKGFAVMTMVFMEVFGDDHGPSLFGDFIRLQDEGNRDVEEGMQAGGSEMCEWMSNSISAPRGWVAHVHSFGSS